MSESKKRRIVVQQYEHNLLGLEFETQMDKRHHVCALPPLADCVGAFQLQGCVCIGDLVRISLHCDDREVAACGKAELLAGNLPQHLSWRIPLLDWDGVVNFQSSNSGKYRLVLETRERWDGPARLLAMYAFVSDPRERSAMSSAKRVALRGLDGPVARSHSLEPWQQAAHALISRQLPPATGQGAELQRCRLTAIPLGDRVTLPFKWKLLLERVEVPAGLPAFCLLIDGRPTAQFSQGGTLLAQGLTANAGFLELPYHGSGSLALGAEFNMLEPAQLDRCLNTALVDGQGIQLRFREKLPIGVDSVELSLFFWSK